MVKSKTNQGRKVGREQKQKFLSKQSFYDTYHHQNDRYSKLIAEHNFTYFYILEFLQEPYTALASRGKVLDIGCGVGTLALLLASQGAKKVTGIDISQRAIKIAQHAQRKLKLKNVEFKVGELKTGSTNFDMIICSEVVEHVENDADFTRRLVSHLKKGGILFLTTPSKQNLLAKIGFYKNFDKRVGHLRRYTNASLLRLLRKNGFKILRIRQVEGSLRNLLFTTRLGFLIKLIRGKWTVRLFHLLDRFSAALFGAADIQVIAKK